MFEATGVYKAYGPEQTLKADYLQILDRVSLLALIISPWIIIAIIATNFGFIELANSTQAFLSCVLLLALPQFR
ncbi:MAG: hypothetical protein CO186_07735 [Zetaproteobacteria bacterium CG_4_9_14_3_um_filter_49_83]|nr:MAG: hypothetical protein AUJ56_11595 [Zetaproteobacteria bacterium CG1_02_49_23]PIQ33802.1 MAG: hypothetical protein COW62_04320 [Zetaproteobacteria bacterium CG17_big_fil_post_rev_8_21_14_2_50_50_13]PIV31628.1 MAG: hypothetical protein COS35_00515 [Zetaproteobacteria bacterium CG02_land_8_20_14_3_00_50_9]PIY55744.1 MAG: hypothetical protein COZ00_07730 [Zetaproteobacteria bacterium CG_4_10_14_0_8_um_filter_49_80]PJA35065.1 MAG: hypothetical protein CO186_07735 [Zetaproteobacteria bacterium